MAKELTQDELRAALAAADRGMKMPWWPIVIASGVSALALGFALKVMRFEDPTHVLVLCAAVFLFGQMQLAAAIITSRQNAPTARMLRALELLDERTNPR